MDETVDLNVSTDPAVQQDLGSGNDTVNVSANAPGQVRLTFTSSEVGNGNPNDSNTMANQDGGLAVRLRAEDGSGALTGPQSRFDDEGITFVASTPGLTFDVRDLVSEVQRGDQFEVVALGTIDDDNLTAVQAGRNYYINAGMGDDRVTGGTANDFLVGGAGRDRLDGGLGSGNDSFIGGGGNDAITGGDGDDRAILNVSTDGTDMVDLGTGADVVAVSAAAPGQVRLVFTSSEVGNGNSNDSNTMANQDGGLAVRLRAENANGALTGSQSRFDDEGITFVASTPGVTFDVRDLVSGVQRGDQFEVVTLGTSGADNLTAVEAGRSYYINAGMGDDTVTGGTANDFLVGGAGRDTLDGGLGSGNDSFIGGTGNDAITGGDGDDRAIFNVSTDGADQVDLAAGADVVAVSSATPGQIRLSFTSSEVGNGSPTDSNTMANQDGGLAVRLRAENSDGAVIGQLSRFDDEGITFVASTPGVTFDVRDLVSGVQRGDQFEVVTLGTIDNDNLTAVDAGRSYYINAGMGDDTVTGGTANDFLVGGAGSDTLDGGLGRGNDSFIGGAGNDAIFGGDGDDRAIFNVSTDGIDRVDLGGGADVVAVSSATPGQVRLTFTSSEVGNGNPSDSNTMANQDGDLAVRLRAEDENGALTGVESRFDDEGITFVASTPGVTFDVRDLVSGVQRGDQFEVVTLGTSRGDTLTAVEAGRSYYINAGMGNDRVTGGRANDFLVGGAGRDTLDGGLGRGNDSFIGGTGNDAITGGDGDDRAIFNVSTDGADQVDLGAGADVVAVSSATPGQVRLTFTSSEVGTGSATDSNTMANQDGGLAVRLRAENGSGALTGLQSRFDDEGITFVASTPGVTFDVRDLVSGVQRGDQFEVVTLGTSSGDTLTAVEATRSYYINAGMGNDRVTGGTANDFLVGGAGRDTLDGGLGSGNDSFIGGGGNDAITGGEGDDRAIFNVSADGADQVDLGGGADVVAVSSATPSQIRLTFTSSEVGNSSATDSGAMANQDGGLAVRLRAESGSGALTGLQSRYDDEGITFVASTPGVTFDVRDLVSGVQRGDQFEVVTLGTSGNDTLTAAQAADSSYYINAGMGNDSVTGGTANDFLVGGAGNDTLAGGLGNDSFIGGAGTDSFVFDTPLNGTSNVDLILDFSATDDTIQLDSAVFTGLPPGTLDPDAFALSTSAGEADDRVIYDATSGSLFFDANGGTREDAVAFAKLTNAPTITADNFFVT